MHLAQKTKEYIHANGKGQHVSVGETLDPTADDFF
jgi:hypothetical protein